MSSGVRNVCSTLALIESSRLKGSLLSADGTHPLNQPVLFLRNSVPGDAPFLLAAAESGDFRTLNFPSTLEGLEQKISFSESSFRGGVANPDERIFMFTVLARRREGGRSDFLPVGTSTLYAKHGTLEKPHHAYQIQMMENNGAALPVLSLTLTLNQDGPAEVGALIVHQAVRGHRNGVDPIEIRVEGLSHALEIKGSCGLAASWVRFFWAAMPGQRNDFRDRICLTEILPSFHKRPDGSRTNHFYEFLVRPYLDGRPYDEMDLATHRDPSLIGRKLRRVIPGSEIPAEAAMTMGRPGPESAPALRLLEKLGFLRTQEIDPLDGGPHLEGRFPDNPIFTGARDYAFGGTARATAGESGEVGWSYGFLGKTENGEGPAFRAVMGAFFTAYDDAVFTTADVAKFLEAKAGDLITISPL